MRRFGLWYPWKIFAFIQYKCSLFLVYVKVENAIYSELIFYVWLRKHFWILTLIHFTYKLLRAFIVLSNELRHIIRENVLLFESFHLIVRVEFLFSHNNPTYMYVLYYYHRLLVLILTSVRHSNFSKKKKK